jgi:hypothetical protein
MAKFSDLNSGRVYGPSHAHVVHVGSGNKHLYSVATVYHTDGEGNVTPHDTMHSSNKKGILSNIKRKYGSIPVSETMKESADIDSMDDISEDAGAYEQWDPKHPNFVKNYKKYKQNNPDGKLKDFVDHMKNKPTQLPEEYDIESMLEYIEELESALAERYDADLDANNNGKLDSDDFKKLRNKKKKSDCNESTIAMLESVIAGDLVESKQSFADILGNKIAVRLAEAKIAIAQGLFGIVESKDADEDDEKSAETSDEDFNKHPLSQLQKIADYKPNSREEDLEYNADGSPDKRSLRALEDRKKKSGSTSGKPTFKHKNGDESDMEPEHAQHLVNVLKGSAVKPDTKKAVLDTIHGSKAGLDKVKSALGTGVVKNKSIYSDPRE